jgi:hypothetical protein
MAVVKKDGSSYKLIYKSAEASDVIVSILNATNDIVFIETIKKSNGFLRPYNLENLPEGQYTFKIVSGSTSQTETIDLRAATIDSDVLKLASVVKIEEGRYMLALTSKDKEQVGIRISNENGETLYSESKITSGAFAQVYNLKNGLGLFTFEITASNGQVRKFVK